MFHGKQRDVPPPKDMVVLLFIGTLVLIESTSMYCLQWSRLS